MKLIIYENPPEVFAAAEKIMLEMVSKLSADKQAMFDLASIGPLAGKIAIFTPTSDCVSTLFDFIVSQNPEIENPEAVALISVGKKAVPTGLPFWIVDDSVLPTDKSTRNNWGLPAGLGDADGVGNLSNEFE